MDWTRNKKNLTVAKAVIVMSLIMLLALEAITSIAYYQKNRPSYLSQSSTVGAVQWLAEKIKAQKSPKKFDEVMGLRKKGIDAYPSYLFDAQFHAPTSYYYLANAARSHIVDCNEAGPFAEWESDELGFRNPMRQLASSVDFLFIGDSFTEGACESEGDTIAGVFRSHGKTVFNLGRGGSGPLFNLATLVEYGNAVKPKVVVWIVFTGNDLFDLREEKTTRLAGYLNRGFAQDLFQNRGQVDAELKSFLQKEISFNLQRLSRGRIVPTARGRTESLDFFEAKESELPLLKEVSMRIKQTTESLGATLSIVILNHRYFNHEIQDLTSEAIRQFCVENGIGFFEFTRQYLSSHWRDLYTPSGPHFSANGYQIVGEDILGWLTSGAPENGRVK